MTCRRTGTKRSTRPSGRLPVDKLEQKRLIKGTPWWMILLAFLGLIGFAIGMVSMPQEDVVQNSGNLLQSRRRFDHGVLRLADRDRGVQGIGAAGALVDHSATVLHISRGGIAWWGCVILMAVGGAALAVGFFLIYVAPMLQGVKKHKYGLRDWTATSGHCDGLP